MFKIFRPMLRDTANEGVVGGVPATAPEVVAPAVPEEVPAPAGSLISQGAVEEKLGEEKPEEGEKTGDEAKVEKPAAVEPLTAESLTFPEGVTVDQGALTDFLGLLNNTEISPAERAQKLIDLQLSIAEEAGKASQALWDQTQSDWQAEALALPEIGGANLPKTLANIKSGLDKLGATAETYAALNFTGAGNHPEIIRILNKATAHLVEGKLPAATVAPAKGNLSRADRMYGNSNME